jgi:DNA integrity scanning protein DisA with diadenylate cyclase activity
LGYFSKILENIKNYGIIILVILFQKRGGVSMGMTDRQFVSYRKEQLEDYEEMLEMAKEHQNPDKKLIRKLEKNIEKARTDIEA